jgi:CHAD domain-containing protein
MFTLSPDEIAKLEQLAKQESGVQQRRARIVMLAGEGKSPREIGGEVQLSDQQVRHWLKQYQAHGMDIFSTEAIKDLAQQAAIPDENQSNAQPKIQKNEKPGVLPDDPMTEAGRKVLAHYFARMLSEEKGVRQGEGIDPVLDMRVATRRLRSALALFSPHFKKKTVKQFRQSLREIADALGAVRDLDVFRQKADKYTEKLPDTQQNKLDPLLDKWKGNLKDARDALIKTLDSHLYTVFVADFEEFVTNRDEQPTSSEQPYRVRHVLPSLIYKNYETVRAYETILATASLDTLHALRIEAKRLRYTLEAFQEVLGPDISVVIDEIKALQDHLGDLQDARVASTLIHDYITQADEQEPMSGILEYLMSREEEKQTLLAAVAERWSIFTRSEIRRALALAVSIL